tara:strand:- start:7604 stop:8788 length:1185 start_codon:yes stop_codon:yes gene_type:complete
MISYFQNKTVHDTYLYFSHFLDHFVMLIFAKAAYDAGLYFDLSYGETIQLGTLGFVLFGLVSPLASRLADYYSRSLLMVVFHFGLGICAVAISFSQTANHLLIGLAGLGAFASIFHPVGIAMLLKNPNKIGFRLGLNGVFGNMGVAAAPLMTGILIFYYDWRTAFLVSGVLCVIYGVVFVVSLRPEINNDTKNDNTGQEVGFSEGWALVLFALAISTTVGGFIFAAVTFLIPRYFEVYMSNLSLSIALTGVLASLVYAFSSFSQVGVGWLIDRVSPKRVLFCMALGQIVFIFFASLFSDWILFIFMTMAVCFVFGQIPITDAIMVRYVPDDWRNRVLSIKFVLNLGVGASVLPVCSFLLSSGYQLSDLFSFMSFSAVVILGASLLLPSQSKRLV